MPFLNYCVKICANDLRLVHVKSHAWWQIVRIGPWDLFFWFQSCAIAAAASTAIVSSFQNIVVGNRNHNYDKELFIAHTKERILLRVGIDFVGSIPTLANKIFHSFLGVRDKQFLIRIYIYHSGERNSSIIIMLVTILYVTWPHSWTT